MKIWVTGGSGFIGSHLVQALLQNGHIVTNVDVFDDFYDYRIKVKNTLVSVGKAENFVFTEKQSDLLRLQDMLLTESCRLRLLDICSEDIAHALAEDRPDLIIHLAALAGVRPSIERPMEYERVNIQGTQNLWEAAKAVGVKKFIIASSSSVYGECKTPPFSEEMPVNAPISPYAATKRACEILGHVYHHLYGMDMLHLRFFTVYGPRQRPDLAIHKFAKKIMGGNPIPFYGKGDTCRDYTYIDDIISGILASVNYVMTHEKVYECINLGESQTISLSEMLEVLEVTLGKKAVLDRQEIPAGDVPITYADISKAKSLLGYHPETNFKDGIKIFVEWFLSNRQA